MLLDMVMDFNGKIFYYPYKVNVIVDGLSQKLANELFW